MLLTREYVRFFELERTFYYTLSWSLNLGQISCFSRYAEKEIHKMNDSVTNFLAQQLYPDLKNLVATLTNKLKTPVKKANAKVFKSPADLLSALKVNELKENQWVTLESKPSMFGPFLRNHFLSPIIGHNTEMRLGPVIQSEESIMGMLGQMTTHLKPVGIYPLIDDDLYQICLYPSDAKAFGVIGLMPGIDRLINYMPAVCNSKHLTFCNMPCNIQGIVRQVSPKLLSNIGVPIEKYEELRQSGDIWFLDITDDYSEIVPTGDAITTEIWGGLYASGHIEVNDGELQLSPLIDGMVESFRSSGFEPYVNQNKAGRKEFHIYGKGIRAIIDSRSPVYSIHMDAELGLDFSTQRVKFDVITKQFLKVIEESALISSAEIGNLHDLDFSYTDSENAYSVLRSVGADRIADPVGIAIRDWHRKRSSKIGTKH